MGAGSRAQGPTLGQRLVAFAERWDDGRILRAAFYLMLVGTFGVMVIDWLDLQDQTAPLVYDPTAEPILPSVERPEIDPGDPAFAPGTRLTSEPAELREPLSINLVPGGVLRLSGTIQPGSAERLLTELAQRGEYVEIIALNSPGGVVQEAIQMGELIREGGYTTEVRDGDLCASSCPLILAGGAERLVADGAVVGVHQIYTGEIPNQRSAQAMSDAQVTTARIARYLEAMQIAPGLWLHALETPPQMLYYLSVEEMEEYGLRTGVPAEPGA